MPVVFRWTITVDTLDDLRALTRRYPAQDHTRLPGPFFRALLVFVIPILLLSSPSVRHTCDARRHSMLTNISGSHSALDAIYHQMLNADLGQALGGHTLRLHVPFKSWEDISYALRESPIAETAVKFFAEYLRDIGRHQHVLWPRLTHDLMVAPSVRTYVGA